MNVPLLDWRAPALQEALNAWCPGMLVEAVAQTGSTNADLMEVARQGDFRPRVRLAQSQTAGRGRLGRVWHSEGGSSLTFSMGLVLRPRYDWGALSLAVGHALANALQDWPQGRPPAGQGWLMLKWPNDLWWVNPAPCSVQDRAAGRKVGGVLIETLPLPAGYAQEGARWVVIGVGLNVRSPKPPTLATLAGNPDTASLAAAAIDEWAPELTVSHCWHAVVPAVLEAVLRFQDEGAAGLVPAVEERDLLVGQPVSISAGPGQPLRLGHCLGMDVDGALRVRDEHGAVVRIVAGEVRVRPAI